MVKEEGGEGKRERGEDWTHSVMDDVPFSGCLLSCRAHAHPLHHRLGGGVWGEGAIMT